MQERDTNVLSIKSFYMLMSTATGRPYLSDANACYLFETKTDGEGFSEGTPGTILADARVLSPQEYMQGGFYGLGIEKIILKERAADFRTIPIEKADASLKQHYNPEAYRLLLRLKQTGDSKYLRKMKDLPFLAPTKIDKRLTGQYPSVHYSYADAGQKGSYYVLFVNIQEFDSWNQQNGGEWSPLAISLTDHQRIRGKNHVLINPLSEKLVLTQSQLYRYIEMEDENVFA